MNKQKKMIGAMSNSKEAMSNLLVNISLMIGKKIIAHRPLTDAPILKGVPLINETYGGGEQ